MPLAEKAAAEIGGWQFIQTGLLENFSNWQL